MATASEVNVGLRKIASEIDDVRTRFERSKSRIIDGANMLGAIPTDNADVLSTIDGYAGEDASEMYAQSEKARLTAEFIALKNSIDALIAEF